MGRLGRDAASAAGSSIWLFSNQTKYVGVVPSHVPAVGDLTFEVGFVITAVIYLIWHAITDRRPAAVPAVTPCAVPGLRPGR